MTARAVFALEEGPVRRPIRMWDGDVSVLAWETAGAKAPAVHFAHANGFNALAYRTLFDELSIFMRVYASDLRGHGQSPWAGDAVHTMELLASDVAAVIRTLSEDGQADVCGLSMGGYVALALMAESRALVRSLVLCNTKATADGPEAKAARDGAINTVLDQGRRAIAAAMLPKLLAPQDRKSTRLNSSHSSVSRMPSSA